MALTPHPNIYEVNTWVWVVSLSAKHGRSLTLDSVPDSEWNVIAGRGIDAVWLMGVWERSPAGARVAQAEQGPLEFGRSCLPNFTLDDVVGSPYSVRQYRPDARLGGFDGLATAREKLSARGIRLILDYVPNQVALDHQWVVEHPEYFISGSDHDLDERPTEFLKAGRGIFALARDPYFPPWPDVLQLNTFMHEVRKAAVETLSAIAKCCDGVRCDMATLAMNPVFARTWGERAGPAPDYEYWPYVIGTVRSRHADMSFLAEAYELEWALLQQGFDYCYDKQLYDRLVQREPERLRLHLRADYSYQRHLVRFIENHDEQRASAVFSPDALKAAAVTVSTLPGASLYHQGQFTGSRWRLPVALGRRPPEPDDQALDEFYRRLVEVGHDIKEGEWQLREVTGWPDNDSFRNILAWCWQADHSFHVVVVNLAETPSQGRVQLPRERMTAEAVVFTDALSGDVFSRDRKELAEEGLYVGLNGYGFHVLMS